MVFGQVTRALAANGSVVASVGAAALGAGLVVAQSWRGLIGLRWASRRWFCVEGLDLGAETVVLRAIKGLRRFLVSLSLDSLRGFCCERERGVLFSFGFIFFNAAMAMRIASFDPAGLLTSFDDGCLHSRETWCPEARGPHFLILQLKTSLEFTQRI